MNTKSNFLKSIFISLILLVGATNAWAWGYKTAASLWNDCSGSSSKFKYVTMNSGTTLDVVMLKDVGDGLNILQNECNGQALYCKWTKTSGDIFRGTARWKDGLYCDETVVIPGGIVYIKVGSGAQVQMTAGDDYTYTADVTFSTTGESYTISGGTVNGATISNESGMPAGGKPSSLTMSNSYTSTNSGSVRITFDLKTNKVTETVPNFKVGDKVFLDIQNHTGWSGSSAKMYVQFDNSTTGSTSNRAEMTKIGTYLYMYTFTQNYFNNVRLWRGTASTMWNYTTEVTTNGEGVLVKNGAWNGAGDKCSFSLTSLTTPTMTATPTSITLGESTTLEITNTISLNYTAGSTSYTTTPQGLSYTFKNGSTQLSSGSSTSYTWTPASAGTHSTSATVSDSNTGLSATATTTITVTPPPYSYTVTAGAGGSVTPTSGTVEQGSGVTITATPDDGYEFDKWTATNGTLANANNASTTFTPSANNAKATASFKLAGCTQTPTTPTSLTAKVGGNALPDEVCSGTNVTLTAGGTISVGSLQWGTGTVGENIIAEGNGRSSITVSPAATTTYWVRSIITEAGVCEGVTSNAKTLQVSVTPALVQPVLSKSTLTLEEGGSTGSITVTSGTTGGTWTSSDQNVATVDNGTVTSVGPGTATITYTVSNACEADKTATCTVTVNAKPYYIAGRLQQNWNTSSTTQQFTYVSNGQYKYETGKTVAELSAQWQDNNYTANQYFFIHAGGGLPNSFTSSNNNGHNFHQKLGYANALTLSSNSENKEAKYIKFADVTDNSSDVVIWWEPSKNKLWYTATANLNTNYYLLGFGNSNWDIKDARRFVKDENDPTKAKVTITLAQGEYKYNTNDGFKINDNFTGKWYGNNGTMTRNNCTGWVFEEGKNNAGLTADIAGDYVFTLDLTNMQLSVTYPEAYTVTYSRVPEAAADAPTTDPSITSGALVLSGTSVTFTAQDAKTGYTFKGWYDNSEGTGTALSTDKAYERTINDNTTIYAVYTANTYDINYITPTHGTFTIQVGSNTPVSANTTADYKTTITLSNTPATGYHFGSWDITPNDVLITNNQTFSMPASNVTIGVTFAANTYKVKFNKNADDATGSMSDQSFTYDEASKALTANAFTRTGYTFTGWNTNANGSGTAYNDGQSVQNLTDVDKGTINLYAQWTEKLSTITIIVSEGGSVKVDGEDFVSGNIVQVGVATTKQVTAVPYEGYGVEAWGVSNKDIVNISGANTVTLKSDGSGSTGTLYANFIGLEYTITFDKQEGTEGTDKATVRYKKNNYSVSPVEAPTRTGYTFGGYYTQAAGAGVQVVSAEGQWLANATDYTDADKKWLVKEDITLYAKWTANKYTVTFDGNGATGGSMSEQGFTYGSEQTLTKNGFTYGDYVFLGWSKEAKGTVEYTDQQSVSNLTTENNGEVVLYAIWATPKTIYLKTVEGTEDGVKWYVRYNSTEDMMTPLGCTGEYYQGEVPEQTEFQLIAKDQNGDVIAKETRDGLVIPNDDKNLFNLVASGASGDKIFFKPNQKWIDKASKDKLHFAGRFWTGSAVWKQMTDDNGDGIYECEKPTNGNEVIFCLVNTTNNINNWGDNWSYKQIQTNGDDAYKQIPNGSNLFTITDNNEDQATGTCSTHADTPVNGEGAWEVFEGITYRITFDQTGATDGETTNGTEYVDAQYRAAMPTIESLPKNTNWKFGGYYTEKNGGGNAITNAFGDWLDVSGYISDGKWAKEACVTLYAHWVPKTPEITVVILDKEAFDAGTAETVTATPTVQEYISYIGGYTICWKMLDNSGTVMESFPFTPGDNNSVTFSTDGLTTGKYTVRASIYDTDCDTGNELSRYDKTFTIVSGYKVTVKYLCDGEVIQASIIAEGHASNATEITAPEIGGYKFVNWELGDGISSESDLNSPTISYTAIYDGYLTAKYEKRKLIFLDLSTLKTKANWAVPHIYLYKGAKDDKDGGYWNDQTGAGGAKEGNYITHAAMTPVPNTENIWYFDYEEYTNNFNVFVAFTSNDQKNATHFANCEAIYRTEFSSGTPVFVPESNQTAEIKNSTAKYYSKGYWVKYMGGTGYWLIIYNEAGDKELVRREFTSATQRMTMTSIIDLEADHTYQYEIYRNDDYYYKGGDITYTNSSTYRPLNEANKHSIHTTETGDYTFTLDYFSGDLQIKVQHPGEVGDYRILYTDDVRGAGKYKPSQIISQNNKEPLVSFFVRPNNNPVLKVQSAAHVTGEGVTWATTENEIFFKPNANWKSDGARFAAYFYNASNNKWVDMKANGDLYSCAKPTDKAYTHVIFCRMDPKNPANNFNKGDGKPLWNQTINIALSDGKNLYTLEEGEWISGQIRLKPNDLWKSDGARFAAYFFEDGKEAKWMSMIADGNTYWCCVPEGYTNVIFCRMNPNNQDNNWNTGPGNPYWDNKTGDLKLQTDGKDLFTLNSGSWSDGSWSNSGKSWSTISGSITDLSNELKSKIGELGLNLPKDTGSVFNIHLSNNEGRLTIDKVALYTGNYYIRVDAVDGKWYDYKTNPDNLMTYSAFSESKANSFGEKFSHYKTKWCSRDGKTMNVKFVIANDYSLCISDTLTQDEGNPFGNIDEHGNITNDGKYDANIRFMWNRHTNKVSRAYVAGASGDNTRFLVLKAGQTIQNESGQPINNNEVVFKDTQNWLYERTIKVQPGTLVKLIAYYPDGNKAQYFRGTSANGFEENVSAVQILGGNSEEWYTMRLIYDFKTNRLMAAWVPDQNINGTLEIDADIMVIRQHQEDATCITFASSQSALTEVKTVYGVMRFNRWILNNRSTSTHNVLPLKEQKTIYERALYFISFPFDVHLSDVFGFGTYGTHWVISTYNGERRAKNGYFVDNCMNEDCTNWDYIWDPDDFTMKANQGYLLSLDLDLMKHDNTSFWEHDIQQVELFFPSYAPVQTIQQTEYTMPALGEEYQCTINFNNANPGETGYNPANDHRVRDSYWRCIGVPSFADYDGSLYQSKEDALKKEPFTWKPKGNDFPFLYEWNVSDNSLMVRAASKYNFRSTFAYLVQNGNPIYWSAVNTKPASIVAKQQGESNNYEWKITLTRNEQVEDQAFIRLSNDEKITNNFDFNQDLSKEFNYGRSDIYTLIGYEKAAANSLPISEQTTVIPLGLSIEYNGDYTLAMPDRVNGIGVTLVDNQTGTRTNLSAGMDYTLTLNKGDYNNRFFIEISPIQQTPTDIEYVTGDTNGKETVRKVLIDNILYIVRDGQIFDARGARVK